MHRLKGKLKGSRLAPDGWRPDIWDSAWLIGPPDDRTMILDFCTELLDRYDLLGMLGRNDMGKVLKEFRDFMDGAIELTSDSVGSSLLMRFLSVDASAFESLRA